MLSKVEITQFIATKLCHDLAGTIGAINNSLDFISVENPEMRAKAIDLLKASSEQSINKLVFFRQAYGVAKNNGEANFDELKITAENYLKDTKVKFTFHEKYFHIKGIFISSNIGKLILCLVQHAYSNLIHGGEITITIEANNIVRISSKGSSLKIDKEKNDIICKNSTSYPLTTQNCTSYFIQYFAKELEIKITEDESQEGQIDYLIHC